jgi:glycine cleavage system H lipoate-binding protein
MAMNADTARLGLDDFANKLVGKIDRVELPAVGAERQAGRAGLENSRGGQVIEMFGSLTGSGGGQ